MQKSPGESPHTSLILFRIQNGPAIAMTIAPVMNRLLETNPASPMNAGSRQERTARRAALTKGRTGRETLQERKAAEPPNANCLGGQ